MTAESEIDDLISRAEDDYAGAQTTIRQAVILGRSSFTGLMLLARRIDTLSEKLDGHDPRIDEDPDDVPNHFTLLGNEIDTLSEKFDALNKNVDESSVDVLAGLAMVAKQIDALSERLDGVKSKIEEDWVDVRAELRDFRRHVTKLTKAKNKAAK